MFCFHSRPSFLVSKTHWDSFSMNCIAYYRRRCKRKVQEHPTNTINLICGNKMPTRCNRWFFLKILFLAEHVSGTIMPIIRSSRVLYRWSLPVVFGALVFKLSVCPVCRLQPANRTHNPQLHTIPTTWKPKYQIPQAATICIILSCSWWWA